MNRDPVCGMDVANKDFNSEIDGKQFLFCSEGCKNQFLNAPDKFSKGYVYDFVIIGGGSAGLTAAVYVSISRMDTFLIISNIGG